MLQHVGYVKSKREIVRALGTPIATYRKSTENESCVQHVERDGNRPVVWLEGPTLNIVTMDIDTPETSIFALLRSEYYARHLVPLTSQLAYYREIVDLGHE